MRVRVSVASLSSPKQNRHYVTGHCIGLNPWFCVKEAWTNRAVETSHESIRTTSFDHPHTASFLNNLGNWVELRYERTASMEDLESAIEVAEESVENYFANR